MLFKGNSELKKTYTAPKMEMEDVDVDTFWNEGIEGEYLSTVPLFNACVCSYLVFILRARVKLVVPRTLILVNIIGSVALSGKLIFLRSILTFSYIVICCVLLKMTVQVLYTHSCLYFVYLRHMAMSPLFL